MNKKTYRNIKLKRNKRQRTEERENQKMLREIKQRQNVVVKQMKESRVDFFSRNAGQTSVCVLCDKFISSFEFSEKHFVGFAAGINDYFAHKHHYFDINSGKPVANSNANIYRTAEIIRERELDARAVPEPAAEKFVVIDEADEISKEVFDNLSKLEAVETDAQKNTELLKEWAADEEMAKRVVNKSGGR
ncbi:MAG: hypothetical protein WA584_23535 [Pyrinomonadaceae bacterium]